MYSDEFSDESVGWPSYVDFLCTFAFVLFLFVGALLYLLSGDIQERAFQSRVRDYISMLTEKGVKVERVGDKLRISLAGNLVFGRGKAALLARHKEYLRSVVGPALRDHPGARRIVVYGYADHDKYENNPFGNWQLSANRAVAVLKFLYLCDDCGYGEDVKQRLTLTGEGDLDSKIGKGHLDRRVDIVLDFTNETSP